MSSACVTGGAVTPSRNSARAKFRPPRKGEAVVGARLAQIICVVIATLIFSLAAPAIAQDDREAAIRATTAALSAIREDIEGDDIDDAAAVEEDIRALRDGARERLDPVAREIARVEADKAALGPAPGENDPPETDSLRQQRSALDARLAQLRSQQIQINANVAEATQLLAELSSARVRSIYSRVTARSSSLLSPPLWRAGAEAVAEIASASGDHVSEWIDDRERRGGLALPLGFIAGSLALFYLLFGPVNRWIDRRFASRIERFEPTPSRRVVVAGLKMLAHAGPGLVGGLLVLETLRAQGFILESGESVARAAWFALVAFLLVNGFVAGLFATKTETWQIAPFIAGHGRRAGNLLIAIVAIFGAKTVLSEIAAAAGAGDAIDRLIDGTSAVAIGVLLFLLCRDRMWRAASAPEAAAAKTSEAASEEGADEKGGGWRLVRRAGLILSLLTIIAPFAGYIDFADFVTSRVYLLSIILAIAWFLRALSRELAALAERRLRGARTETEEARGFDLFWINAMIDVMFVIALAPAILVLAGYRWSFVRDFIAQAFFGFRIGGFEIPSLAKILVAIAVFVAFLALTRLVQRGLEKGPFAHSRIDPGVQNSLTTLIGYGGLVIALLAGVISLGVNLANLAIIAGALSVGIGFGLQSIVNNFVSGLILLFERPIKVGDWVVTTAGEGTVKKISVRSTEIETFDRSSIIVPNSELISQTVTNWTHKDKIGRITVPVGVAYKSDPEAVRDILLKCARDHPQVVRYPEPFVVWKDFGASSLDFEVRAYLRDISNGLTVRTELRFAIFKAFREAGIEIPYPQQDIYVRSLPGPEEKKPVAKKRPQTEKVTEAPPNEPELAEDD